MTTEDKHKSEEEAGRFKIFRQADKTSITLTVAKIEIAVLSTNLFRKRNAFCDHLVLLVRYT